MKAALLLGPVMILGLAAPAQAAPVACSTSNSKVSVKRCLEQAAPVLGQAYQQVATAAGTTWQTPQAVTFWRKPPPGACEEGNVPSSFYCPDSNTAYMMMLIAKDSTKRYARLAKPAILRQDARAAGVSVKQLRKGYAGAAQVNVLAHEMAHALLETSGVWLWYSQRSDRYPVGSARYDRFGYVHETIADCLSAVAQRTAKDNGTLRMDALDLWAARADYAGADPFDNTAPKASPFVYDNGWGKRVYRGYGGPYIRVKAFNHGWSAASTPNPLQSCVRFSAALKKVPVPPQIG